MEVAMITMANSKPRENFVISRQVLFLATILKRFKIVQRYMRWGGLMSRKTLFGNSAGGSGQVSAKMGRPLKDS
jgi:hypothetical protein